MSWSKRRPDQAARNSPRLIKPSRKNHRLFSWPRRRVQTRFAGLFCFSGSDSSIAAAPASVPLAKPAHTCLHPRAQCYPRHACPLCASLLMQLHTPRKTAPLLALQGVSVPQKLMRIHARYACMAHLRVTAPENSEEAALP